MLTLSAEKFEFKSGADSYAIDLEDGDCQLDYLVLSDMQCAVYLGLGDKVLPIAVGTRVSGRLLVKDAHWLMVKPENPAAQVAIQVFHVARRVVDANDGKPVAVYVPTLPPVDLRAQVSRLVAQRLEETDSYLIDRDPPELPDDLDEEFGPGSVQLEDDDEIEEHLNALRKRKKDTSPSEGGEEGGEAAPGGDAKKGGVDKNGGAKKKPPKKKVEPAPVEEVD